MICRNICKKYEDEGKGWLKVKGDDMWSKVCHLIVDSVEAPGERWLRSCGFDEAWKVCWAVTFGRQAQADWRRTSRTFSSRTSLARPMGQGSQIAQHVPEQLAMWYQPVFLTPSYMPAYSSPIHSSSLASSRIMSSIVTSFVVDGNAFTSRPSIPSGVSPARLSFACPMR